jgi:RNA polymerase sigma factor (sigma-70 family)
MTFLPSNYSLPQRPKPDMRLEALLNERHRLRVQIIKIDHEVWELLKKHRTKLDKRTYKILKMRLYEKKTLEEVAKEMSVTRERIRQIEHKGIIELDNIL